MRRDSQGLAPAAGQPSREQLCNDKIARLFGGVGADVATNLDYKIVLGKNLGKTIDRSDHLYKDGVFHIYTDTEGSFDKDVPLYVPNGAKFRKPAKRPHGEYQDFSGEWKNEFVFNLSGQYKGVSIFFVHVAGTYGGKHGGAYLGKEFINSLGHLTRNQNADKTATQIGFIGGLAGEGRGEALRHTHVVVKVKGVRTDPRKVFCGF